MKSLDLQTENRDCCCSAQKQKRVRGMEQPGISVVSKFSKNQPTDKKTCWAEQARPHYNSGLCFWHSESHDLKRTVSAFLIDLSQEAGDDQRCVWVLSRPPHGSPAGNLHRLHLLSSVDENFNCCAPLQEQICPHVSLPLFAGFLTAAPFVPGAGCNRC